MNIGSLQDITIHTDPGDVPDLAPLWARARAQALYHSTPLEDFLADSAGRACLVTATGSSGGPLVLPFLREQSDQKFTVGERRLGAVRAQALRLANPWLAQGHNPQDIAALLRHVLVSEHADLLVLGEIPEASVLRAALDHLHWPARGHAVGRKESLRWLIALPDSFDAYMAELSKGTRQSIRRKMRKLDKDFDVTLEIFSDPDGLDRFLQEGETISRLTYQWHVGQRLVNDTATQTRYAALAAEGRLRCYLMSLDGVPRAFLRGTLDGTTYHYETPGFDPAFGRTSIGNIILMEAIRDLIETSDAAVFDFGTGGDNVGYKSTFGTQHILCNSYNVLSLKRPRSLAIWGVGGGLNSAKDLADRVLPDGEMRARIKRKLRQYRS